MPAFVSGIQVVNKCVRVCVCVCVCVRERERERERESGVSLELDEEDDGMIGRMIFNKNNNSILESR